MSHFPLGENKTQSRIANATGTPEIQKNVGTRTITKASLFSLQSVRLLHDNQVNSAGDSNDHRATHKSLHKMSVYFWAESLRLYILSYLVLTITTKVGDTNPQMLREFINLSRIT